MYLLVGVERGDTFWERLVSETRPRSAKRIVQVDTLATVTAEEVAGVRGVIIPLTPGPWRRKCSGIERFLQVKRSEAKVSAKNEEAARVVVTLFCSFLSAERFEEIFTGRFSMQFGEHSIDSLCATHLRMPFDARGLAGALALAESNARRLSSKRYKTIYLHALSQLNQVYFPHQ